MPPMVTTQHTVWLAFLLVVLALASARITRLIVNDTIARPLQLLAIRKLGETHPIVTLLHCPWCTGWWVSAILTGFAWATGLTGGAAITLLLIPAVAYATAWFGKNVEG